MDPAASPWYRGRDRGMWLCCVLGCPGQESLLLWLLMVKQQKLSELIHMGSTSPKPGDIPREEMSQRNMDRLRLGKEGFVGNYRSINWSAIKGELLEWDLKE